MYRAFLSISLIITISGLLHSQIQVISISNSNEGRTFEGIGALSAGASSKLLLDYPVEIREQILDYLFKPKFGASLQHLKVEIGGDVNSTDGTEPSHAHTREELISPEKSCFTRGYEWMLMKEAKRRNPSIFLDCLEWGCPGWIGNGIFYSQDNADYISAFIEGAEKYHNLKIDYTGIWNERDFDAEWIKLLRKTLDKNGLNHVKIIAPDTFDWGLAELMMKDKILNEAVYAVGIHYNERWKEMPYSSTIIAKNLNKSLRNSEGGPWRGDWEGFEYLVKLYNRNYIEGKSTNVITWSLVTSYYDNLSIPNSGLMYAKTPWSGYFEVQPGLWAAAHTTQFAEPGWKYIDPGCGYLEKGSYVTLVSPDRKEFSIIIETVDATASQTVNFKLDAGFGNRSLHVWKSTKGKTEFEKQSDIRIKNNNFTITLDGKSAYSITTTTGQTKGYYKAPENKPFPLPYKTGFETDSIGQLARYFMDQAGVFEVHRRTDGTGNCLRQVIDHQGIEWEVSHNPAVETILGDTAWTDYEVNCDVLITENTGSARILGRIMDTKRGTDFPDGYTFIITTGNKWTLMEGNRVIGTGWAEFPPFKWHHLSLTFKGSDISVRVNNKLAVSVTSAKYSHGLAGIGSALNYAEFDNFEVK